MFEPNQIICGAMPRATKVLPNESVNCSISSPPYWALRDYGVEGQLGLEPTFEEYIDKLCNIYDEVWRVLRKDGTCFVNLGDTYSSGNRTSYDKSLVSRSGLTNRSAGLKRPAGIFAEKTLALIPQRFAIEMVNRGWILRNTIIWHKPNPMPSSAKDRFTVDFEYVFFFVKSNDSTYWIHNRKVRMKAKRPNPDYIWIHKNTGFEVAYQPFSDRICKGKKRLWNRRNLWEGQDYWFEPQYEPHNPKSAERYGYSFDGSLSCGDPKGMTQWSGIENQWQQNPLGRNKRTVWTIPTQSFSEAHFATFPEKLVEPMILSGCPEFVCKKCGMGRRKAYETESHYTKREKAYAPNSTPTKVDSTGWESPTTIFKGYTDCGCNAGWRPGIVLDLFCGELHNRKGRCKIAA